MYSYIIVFILGYIVSSKLTDWRHRFHAAFTNWLKKSNNPTFQTIKEELFSELKTKNGEQLRILEIGVGTGTNFKFYPNGCHLIAVDPNHHYKKYYYANKEKFSNIKTEEFIIAFGEDMHEVPDGSVDAVVISKVLCCVMDVSKILQEIRRVLVKDGKLFFIEHVREWDTKNHPIRGIMQDILSNFKIWPAIFDGCTINSNTAEDIKNSDFKDLTFKRVYGPYDDSFIFQLSNCYIVGTATK